MFEHVAVIDLAVQRRNGYCYYSLFCGQIIYLRRLKIVQLCVCTNAVFSSLKLFSLVAIYGQIRTVLFHWATDISYIEVPCWPFQFKSYSTLPLIILLLLASSLVHRSTYCQRSFSMAIQLPLFFSFNTCI